MAEQYSNRQFFRKTPHLYLSKFFEAKGIQLDVNINQLKEHDTDIIQSALNNLSLEQITDIETEFQNINALACDGGILALVDEARFHKDDAFIEDIAVIEGFHA